METKTKIEWTKSGTTTSYIGGADWSRSALVDGWGDAGETEIKFLTDKVQEAFHRQAEEAGSSASWVPYTAEVIHDINEPDEFMEKYNEWRYNANEEVWNRYCSGDYAEELKALYVVPEHT